MSLAPVLLDSQAINAGATWNANVGPGKWEALGIALSGTTNAGGAVAETDFGRIRLSEQGRDLANIDADMLRRIGCIKGGNHFQSLAGGNGISALWYSVIPRGYYDTNVHSVLAQDQTQLSMTFVGNWTTRITSALWKLYGFRRQTGKMRYNLKMIQYDFNLATGTIPTTLTDENIVALYFEVNANLAGIVGKQDGDLAFSVLRPTAGAVVVHDLNAWSDIFNRTDSLAAQNTEGIAAVDSAVMEVAVAEPGEIGEFLSDSLQMDMTASGAITPQSVVVMSADFAPTKLRSTQIESASVVQRKMSRKTEMGRTRPLEALRMEAGG